MYIFCLYGKFVEHNFFFPFFLKCEILNNNFIEMRQDRKHFQDLRFF